MDWSQPDQTCSGHSVSAEVVTIQSIGAYASGTRAVLDSKNGTVTEVNFDDLPQHIVPAEAAYFLRQKKAHFR